MEPTADNTGAKIWKRKQWREEQVGVSGIKRSTDYKFQKRMREEVGVTLLAYSIILIPITNFLFAIVQ